MCCVLCMVCCMSTWCVLCCVLCMLCVVCVLVLGDLVHVVGLVVSKFDWDRGRPRHENLSSQISDDETTILYVQMYHEIGLAEQHLLKQPAACFRNARWVGGKKRCGGGGDQTPHETALQSLRRRTVWS